MITITPGQMTPQYETSLFTDIYSNVNDFVKDYNECEIPRLIKEENVRTIFYLLYAKYGNDPIANFDVNQFKYKLFATIFKYGPTWEKRLELQAELRKMSIEEAATGATSIYNHAFNPGEQPSTQTTAELNYINDQNVSKYKKSKTDAFMHLWDLLRVDITDEFIKRFARLFDPFAKPVAHDIYTTVIED